MLHLQLSVDDSDIIYVKDCSTVLEFALSAAEDEEFLISDEEYQMLMGEYSEELLSESAETAFGRR
jgi:hypothetical protein